MGIIVQFPNQDMQSFISVTQFEKLDQLLNNIKVKALECLNYLFKYLFEEVPNQTKLESPFMAKGLTLCPYFIQTLLSISVRPDIQLIIQDETYQNIIVESMETLALFVGEKEFFQLIVDKQRDLLVKVCLNLMRTTPQEYEEMTSDPEQFVNLALDTCDKQKSKVVKT